MFLEVTWGRLLRRQNQQRSQFVLLRSFLALAHICDQPNLSSHGLPGRFTLQFVIHIFLIRDLEKLLKLKDGR